MGKSQSHSLVAEAFVNAFMSFLSFINYEWPLSQEPQKIPKYDEGRNKIRWQNNVVAVCVYVQYVCVCVCVGGQFSGSRV